MKKRMKKKILNYVKTNYILLDNSKFIGGKTYMNQRCHINAVQDAYDNKSKVLLTFCIGNNEMFVHFINETKNGKYIDNTLGWFGRQLYDYYLIREVEPFEYATIWKILYSTKRTLINLSSNRLERALKMVREDDI